MRLSGHPQKIFASHISDNVEYRKKNMILTCAGQLWIAVMHVSLFLRYLLSPLK
jgi:hypothetical protein